MVDCSLCCWFKLFRVLTSQNLWLYLKAFLICFFDSSAKAHVLVNSTLHGFIRWKRGLRQGDPADSLSAMFMHALRFRALLRAPLGQLGNVSHLQYVDDIIIFFAWGHEDLQVIKLILYPFEGASGLTINYSKSCLYSISYGFRPNANLTAILNCARDCLSLTYLGAPLLGKRPRRQDWLNLILKVRTKLTSWKAIYLSLGSQLTLINSTLSSIRSYWMPVFKLPVWISNEIDKIRRDFL